MRMQRRDFLRYSGLAACVAAGDSRVFADSSGSTLRRSRGGTLTSLDPHRGISATDMEINADLFVGLTAIDARGAITPGLASDWTISADGRRYEFRLRRNLRWSDGSGLDSADVVASFRRMLAADTGMLLAYRYDAIVGAAALRRGKAAAAALGVRTGATPDTVIFELLRPETDLLKLLAVASSIPVIHSSCGAIAPAPAPYQRGLAASDKRPFCAQLVGRYAPLTTMAGGLAQSRPRRSISRTGTT